MNTNDNLEKIMSALEKIRSDKYSHVSAEIINTIINIQFQNQEQESRHSGRIATHQAIKKYVEENSQGGNHDKI